MARAKARAFFLLDQTLFGGCFVFQIDHLLTKPNAFRWLMSTPGARPNHRKSAVFPPFDKTKYQEFY
jgi:hypothetical protein